MFIPVFALNMLNKGSSLYLALAEPLSTHFTHFTHCHRQPISPISLTYRVAGLWLSHCQPISPISLTAIVNPFHPFHSPTESLDKRGSVSLLRSSWYCPWDFAVRGTRLGLAASQLVVLSVGFRSPRELGKFYVIPGGWFWDPFQRHVPG